jgi:uncharacterized protein (DUF2141 family)
LNKHRHLGFLSAAILALGMAMPPVLAQETTSLVIHVKNVAPQGGILRLGLYDQAHYPDDNSAPVAGADVSAKFGETVIVLDNIAPGSYAIEAYQDVNANNKMDFSWLGLPLEPFGFSRDARPHFSKPEFSQVKFDVAAGANVQTLHLQNSVSLFAAK